MKRTKRVFKPLSFLGSGITNLTLLSIFLCSINSYAEASIQDHIDCLRHDSDGICLGYRLPYNKNQTIKGYIKDMESRLSTSEINEAKNLAKNFRHNWPQKTEKKIDDLLDIKSTAGLGFNIQSLKSEIRAYTLALLKEIYRKIEDIEEYTLLNQGDILRLVHALYCRAFEIHLDVEPNFHELTNNNSVRSAIDPEGRVVILFSDEDIQEEMGHIGGLIMILNEYYDFYHQWTSIETTQWIIDTVPKMKEKPVLELAAGSGYQALLLRLNDVDIKATDKEPSSIPYTPVEALSAKAALEKYQEKYKILFLQYPPIEVLQQTLNFISETPGLWTVAFTSPSEMYFSIPDNYKYEEHSHPSSLNEAVFDYLQGSALYKTRNSLYIIQNISEEPRNPGTENKPYIIHSEF